MILELSIWDEQLLEARTATVFINMARLGSILESLEALVNCFTNFCVVLKWAVDGVLLEDSDSVGDDLSFVVMFLLRSGVELSTVVSFDGVEVVEEEKSVRKLKLLLSHLALQLSLDRLYSRTEQLFGIEFFLFSLQ